MLITSYSSKKSYGNKTIEVNCHCDSGFYSSKKSYGNKTLAATDIPNAVFYSSKKSYGNKTFNILLYIII